MLTLDAKGVLAALIIVFLIIGTTGDWRYIAVMVLFLILAAYVTIMGITYKRAHGFYESKRGVKNVISNGIIPVIFAVANIPSAFIGAMAAVTADKFASELGVFDKRVWDVLTLKPTQPGVDGAVSWYGLLASLVGSAFIAITGSILFGYGMKASVGFMIAGFLGSIADSIAGHFEARGMGTKETSNIIGSLTGGLLGMLFNYLLGLM